VHDVVWDEGRFDTGGSTMTCSRHALGRRMQGCLLRPHPGVPAGGAATM